MGCGKSSRGKQLAKKMNLKFIDLDDYIAEQEGVSIDEIFQRHGEIAFRKIESNALRDLSVQSDFVMATGGGTACFYNNMDLMNSSGITVYLELDNKSLFNRLKNSRKIRPLIKNMSDLELMGFIETRMQERKVYYNSAKYIVSALNLNVEDIAEILQRE